MTPTTMLLLSAASASCHAGNENAGAGGTSGGAHSSELLPTPGVGQGTDATPMGPGNMRTRVSSYLPTPVSRDAAPG